MVVFLTLMAAGRPTIAEQRDPVQRARQHLSEVAPANGLRSDLVDLRVTDVRRGLSGDNVRFQQTRNGIPVFGAAVSVTLPADGARPLITNRYDARPAVAEAPALASRAALLAAIRQPGDVEVSPAELVYAPSGKLLVPAWQLTLRSVEPRGSWLVLVDAVSGDVLYRHNLLSFDTGRVFDPNPAQTNGGTAPAGHCDSGANEALLAGEYTSKTLQGIAPGQDKLKGQWVDLTAPGVPPPSGTAAYKAAGQASEPSRNYLYPCNDDRFEEVMVYYHLDRTQRKLQALGFAGASGVVQRPVSAHAHFMPDCNAFFDPTNRALHFGDFNGDGFFPAGCGAPPLHDSAEDADWIIHEYGHAIQDDQIPGFAFGPYPLSEQAASIGEGFSDFLAAALNQDPCWGEYANFGVSACNGAPGNRTLQNSRVFPAGFEACPDIDANGLPGDGAETQEPHCGGEVWGGALWDLAEAIAGGPPGQQALDVALTLVLDSQFYLDQRATFDEAAAAICLADNILYNGDHASEIAVAFAGRGISSGACTASDFPSFFIRILHPYSGDLDVNLKVGSGVDQGGAPVCSFNVADPDSENGTANFHVRYVYIINDAVCLGKLPPTVAQPWWLEVRDTAQLDEGSIEDFEVLLPGGSRCIATPLPVAIPDAFDPDDGPAVYAKVDCSLKITAPISTPTPSPTPTPVPGPTSFGNVDCSSAINSVDALKLLRYVAGLSYTQDDTPPCPDIGIENHPNGELQGDVNCSNTVNSVDALLLLRYSAALSVTQNEPCPDIGS